MSDSILKCLYEKARLQGPFILCLISTITQNLGGNYLSNLIADLCPELDKTIKFLVIYFKAKTNNAIATPRKQLMALRFEKLLQCNLLCEGLFKS